MAVFGHFVSSYVVVICDYFKPLWLSLWGFLKHPFCRISNQQFEGDFALRFEALVLLCGSDSPFGLLWIFFFGFFIHVTKGSMPEAPCWCLIYQSFHVLGMAYLSNDSLRIGLWMHNNACLSFDFHSPTDHDDLHFILLVQHYKFVYLHFAHFCKWRIQTEVSLCLGSILIPPIQTCWKFQRNCMNYPIMMLSALWSHGPSSALIFSWLFWLFALFTCICRSLSVGYQLLDPHLINRSGPLHCMTLMDKGRSLRR